MNETNRDHYSEQDKWSDTFLLIYTIVMMVTFTVGFLGNLLVIYVIAKFTSMKTVTNIHIVSLAIADAMYLLSMPIFLYTMHSENGFVFGTFGCKVFWFLTTVNSFAGAFGITALSADRFAAILYYMQTKRFRQSCYALLIVATLWCLAIGLMLPIIVSASVKEHGNGFWECNPNWPRRGNMAVFGLTLYTCIIGYLIPCCLLVFFYARIVQHMMAISGAIQGSKERAAKQKKTTRLIFIVMLIYIVLWLPHWAHQFSMMPGWLKYIRHFDMVKNNPSGNNSYFSDNMNSENTTSAYYHYLNTYLSYVFSFFGYLNSTLNPIIYTLMSSKFRQCFKSVLYSLFCQNSNEIENHHHSSNVCPMVRGVACCPESLNLVSKNKLKSNISDDQLMVTMNKSEHEIINNCHGDYHIVSTNNFSEQTQDQRFCLSGYHSSCTIFLSNCNSDNNNTCWELTPSSTNQSDQSKESQDSKAPLLIETEIY